tara:strand:+ start:4199 stop:4813 length:615 start_codon:yes stop_codon:yes gene_type:complete
MADITISEVRISNMALSNIGANSTIETMEENSAEAKECNLWYHYSRLQALAANDWSWARRRLTLTAHSIDPPSGVWGYRYQYPSDCVVFRSIQNPAGEKADPIPFEIEAAGSAYDTKSILTDADDAIGVYTFDQRVVTMFSEFFVEMFAFALASHIVFALTGSKELRKEMIGGFQSMARIAPASDANERAGAPPRDTDWIRGRA